MKFILPVLFISFSIHAFSICAFSEVKRPGTFVPSVCSKNYYKYNDWAACFGKVVGRGGEYIKILNGRMAPMLFEIIWERETVSNNKAYANTILTIQDAKGRKSEILSKYYIKSEKIMWLGGTLPNGLKFEAKNFERVYVTQ